MFTGFDAFAIGVVLVCALMAGMRGAIGEVIAVLRWIVAFGAGRALALPAGQMLGLTLSPDLSVAAGFLLVFGVTWVVLFLLRSMLTSVVRALGLGGLNGLLGASVGAAKGVFLVTLVVIAASFTGFSQSHAWRDAYTAPGFERLALAAVPYLPGFVAQKVRASGLPETSPGVASPSASVVTHQKKSNLH